MKHKKETKNIQKTRNQNEKSFKKAQERTYNQQFYKKIYITDNPDQQKQILENKMAIKINNHFDAQNSRQ